MFALFSRILKLSGRYKSRIQGAFVCAFLESILSKMPIFLAFVVLSGFANKTITGQTCLYVGLGLAAIVLVQMLVHYLSDSLQSAAGYLMFADKRIELGGHLRKLPMGYFTSGNIGKISSVLSTDMVFIEEVAMSTLGNMMSYLLSSLVLLAFMFYLNWRLGLIAAIVTILAWLVSKGMNKVSLREAAGRQEQSERLTDAVLSFVEGIGVIKSYNLLGEKSEELSGNFKRSRNTSLDFERKMTPWTMGLNILYGIGIAAIFGLSIVLEQSGALSLAYVLGVLLFVFDLFGPLKALYGEASRLTVMNAALDRIEAVLDEPELSDNGKQHIPAQAQPGQPEVLFNDVTFAYQDKEVLHHISFAMKKNSMTALVGPSGSGKSTIANLLARLWDVKSGNVTIRGVDIRNVPLSELMDQISMVFQRVYLFQDTIYNNISMGKPDATEEEVYEAAKKARCYDFIIALPDGFQTVIGEGGATLSGGEKQRISIARCILKDAPIVILDEATASVDTDNESYIQEAISELVKGKTLLVIAHRLNTIRQADQILVIDNGQIAQQGTHLMLALLDIVQGVISTIMQAAGFGQPQSAVLPSEIVSAIEDCGFFESIPLWAVTLIGGLFIWVLSFQMILSVYGRFFKMFMYTAIAPIPLSTFAGEPTQSIGKSFLKSYASVCMEGAVIVLACVIFSAFASSPPVVDAGAAAATMVWSYIGELIFNMLILVGSVKMADRVVREMMGL